MVLSVYRKRIDVLEELSHTHHTLSVDDIVLLDSPWLLTDLTGQRKHDVTCSFSDNVISCDNYKKLIVPLGFCYVSQMSVGLERFAVECSKTKTKRNYKVKCGKRHVTM